MDVFKKKFIEEATDHIQDLEEALLQLDKGRDDKELIERVFRAMHSLKGGGAMFGFNEISSMTHNLESIYDQIRNGKTTLSDEILNLTFETVDVLKLLVDVQAAGTKDVKTKYNEVLEKINTISQGGAQDAPEHTNLTKQEQAEKTYYIRFEPEADIMNNGTNPLFLLDEMASMGTMVPVSRTGRISELEQLDPEKCYTSWEIILTTSKTKDDIEDVFMFVDEDSHIEIQELGAGDLMKEQDFLEEFEKGVSSAHLDLNKLREAVKEKKEEAVQAILEDTIATPTVKQKETKISSIRVDSDKIDSMMNLVSELVTTQARLSLFAEKNEDKEMSQISENVQKLTRDLRDLAFNIALIPIDQVITRFQRMVRDLSKEMGKKVEFRTEGTDTELDKNIIESLTDPILHILRNAVDHGIETPEEREKAGKPETGTIHFHAYYSGSSVYIKIHNDGAEMDADRIRQKAIDKKIITPEETLSRKEILNLVFTPGFSTSENVTGVSGRGVGMDVVKRKVAEIRGEVDIDSQKGEGTTVTIKLPLTLSIIDGLLVNINQAHYIIPLVAVDKIFGIPHEEIKENLNRVVVLDGQQVPYLYLRNEFGVGLNGQKNEQAVVVHYEEKRVALIVDYVVGEYQAVLKTLGKHYQDQEMVSGGTILGDGSVALVLDTNKMITKCTEQLNNN